MCLVLGRGVGQVLFQGNALSGWLMWSGIFFCSWRLGLLALCGNLAGTATARLLGYSRVDISDGLYGFNGTLVGLAVGVLMHLSWLSLFLMVLAASVSTVIARLFSRQRLLLGFTMPFILAVWLLAGICSWVAPGLFQASPVRMASTQPVDWPLAFVLGIGQVMFMDKVLAGVCFLSAILVHSRRAACYTVLGALLPIPLAVLLGVDGGAISAGLMGYNGVLSAIALGDDTRTGFVCASSAVCLSVVLQVAGLHLGFTTLTAPFVLSVWFVTGVRRMLPRKTQV